MALALLRRAQHALMAFASMPCIGNNDTKFVVQGLLFLFYDI